MILGSPISGRGKKFFPSRLDPLWDPPSLLLMGGVGILSGGKAGRA